MKACLPLLSVFLLPAMGAHAAISGSDDFNDNSKDATKWAADIAEGGVLTETNSRIEYTAPTGSDERFIFRPWNLNKASYDTDWEVTMDVRNTLNLTSGAPKEATMSLLVYPTGTPPTVDEPKALSVGLFADFETNGFKGFSLYSDDADQEELAETPTTSGAVRLAFNSRSKVIHAYYDADGATNGYVWTPLGSMGVNGSGGGMNGNWGMAGSATFEVAICGSSEGIAITSGQVTADNFAARTIPARTTLTATPAGDDFNDNVKNTTNWDPDIGEDGIFNEANGRLEYIAPTTEERETYRPWAGAQPNYGMNWETTIDLANTVDAAGVWESGIGITVTKGGDTGYQFWVEFNTARYSPGLPVEGQMLAAHDFAGEDTGEDDQYAETTPGIKTLRITFNAASKVFTTYYDVDGPSNGHQWTPLGSFGIAGSGGAKNANWGMTGSEPFDIAPYGFSEDVVVSSGKIYADNFTAQATGTRPALATGADDFNDNSKNPANWGSDIGNGSMLTEISGRLEYTGAASAEDEDFWAFRPWAGGQPHYGMNWETTIDLTNTMDTVGDWDTGMGIAILKGGPDLGNQFWMELGVFRSTGDDVEAEIKTGHIQGGDDFDADRQEAPTTPGAKSIRIMFNATTKVFTTYYDADGAANGYSWTPLGSFGITGSGGDKNANWGMSGSQPFDIAIYGFSNEVVAPGGKIHADNFAVHAITESLGIHEWKALKFGTASSPSAAFTADTDQDGLTNLSEYAFNLDTAKGELPVMLPTTGTTGLPRITTTGTGATQKLRLEYVRRKASSSPGITYAPQFSGNLSDIGTAPWTNFTGTESVTSIDTTWERVVVEDTVTGQQKRFGRVRVVNP